MAITSFIPELWSKRLLRALEKAHVYGGAAIINRDYEGEIRQGGDTVHIGLLGEITIKDYDRTQPIDAPEVLSTTDQTLLIDQEKYYNFKVDDIDAAQAAGALMGPALLSAAYQLRDVSDAYIASLYADFTGGEIGDDGDPEAIAAAADAYDALVDLSVLLDEANVPDEGRFAVIPPWYAGLLAKDDRLITNVPGLIATGLVGVVDRLTIYRSNQVPNTGGDLYKIIAGHSIGWSFAEQIVKTEAYRQELGFADGVKGLHVYGAKVVRPTAFALLTATRATGS